MVLVCLIMVAPAFAEILPIKVEQTVIDLPYWPAANHANYGAALIVQGGSEPQGSPLLNNFAQQLAARGWSVALLNANKNATIPWIEQLPEAIGMLRQQKNKRIVLIHYGEQLNQSLDYFTKPHSKMINGLVMVSAYDNEMEVSNDTLRFPLFDISGQFDYDAVLRQVAQRRQEFKNNYLAIEMPGAHHDYEYSTRLLLGFVHGWMTKLPETQIAPKPVLESYLEPINSMASLLATDESNWFGFIDNPVEPD